MDYPGLMFPLMMVLGLAFYGFLLWLAWVLVSSVRGIRMELTKIREEIARLSTARGA